MPLSKTLLLAVCSLAYTRRRALAQPPDLMRRMRLTATGRGPDTVETINRDAAKAWAVARHFSGIAVHEALLELGLELAARDPAALDSKVIARNRCLGRPSK